MFIWNTGKDNIYVLYCPKTVRSTWPWQSHYSIKFYSMGVKYIPNLLVSYELEVDKVTEQES